MKVLRYMALAFMLVGCCINQGSTEETLMPEIGETITIKKALILCEHFGIDYIAERLKKKPGKYRTWKFDGCSGLVDELMGYFTGSDWRLITYQCCLPHDLRYAYGDPGNEDERRQADERFYQDLITRAHMDEEKAEVFLAAVRALGKEKYDFSFSWAFAHEEK